MKYDLKRLEKENDEIKNELNTRCLEAFNNGYTMAEIVSDEAIVSSIRIEIYYRLEAILDYDCTDTFEEDIFVDKNINVLEKLMEYAENIEINIIDDWTVKALFKEFLNNQKK